LQAAGRPAEAETEAMRAWAELEFTAEEEAALLALQPEALARVHEVRLDNLLWDGRRGGAADAAAGVRGPGRRWPRPGWGCRPTRA
jgi:hypothetical protein